MLESMGLKSMNQNNKHNDISPNISQSKNNFKQYLQVFWVFFFFHFKMVDWQTVKVNRQEKWLRSDDNKWQ